MDDIENRIKSLEDWRNEQNTEKAVQEIRRTHMDERFDRIDQELSGMKSSFNKILWSIGLLALTAVGNFILQGGLNVATP